MKNGSSLRSQLLQYSLSANDSRRALTSRTGSSIKAHRVAAEDSLRDLIARSRRRLPGGVHAVQLLWRLGAELEVRRNSSVRLELRTAGSSLKIDGSYSGARPNWDEVQGFNLLEEDDPERAHFTAIFAGSRWHYFHNLLPHLVGQVEAREDWTIRICSRRILQAGNQAKAPFGSNAVSRRWCDLLLCTFVAVALGENRELASIEAAMRSVWGWDSRRIATDPSGYGRNHRVSHRPPYSATELDSGFESRVTFLQSMQLLVDLLTPAEKRSVCAVIDGEFDVSAAAELLGTSEGALRGSVDRIAEKADPYIPRSQLYS